MENDMSTKNKTKRKKTSFWGRLLDGDLLMHPFVKRNLGLIVLIVGLAILYEGNRYACQKDLVRIRRCQAELLDLRNESVVLNNDLRVKSLRSNIQTRLENENSSLKPATNAPIVIEK